MHDSEFRQSLRRYAQLRAVVYALATHDADARAKIPAPFSFTDIDSAALDAWSATWTRVQPFGYGGWDWIEIARPIHRRPSGLGLAIWSGDRLCGLLAGRASKRRRDGCRHTLSLYYLEGSPDLDHPLVAT